MDTPKLKPTPTWVLWPLCGALAFFGARHFLDQGSGFPATPNEVARSGNPAAEPPDEDPVTEPEIEVVAPVATPARVSAATPATPPAQPVVKATGDSQPAVKATSDFVSHRLPQVQPSAPVQAVIPPPPPPTSSGPGRGSASPNYLNPGYRPPVAEHYVQPHMRKDGTAVQGHYRTNPDDSFWNNYSSKGNVNPHTGQTGTRMPPNTTRRTSPPSLNIQPLRILPPLGGRR